MKKLAILTSVLALTACGGGSGGNGGGITSIDAVTSNANVTGMRTSIEVDSHGNMVSSRQSSLSNGNIVYDLSDVDFTISDESFGMQLQFDVDSADKKITGISIKENDEPDINFDRRGDTTQFDGKVCVDDGCNSDDSWIDATLDYKSFGKDAGLKYSDFGTFSVDVWHDWDAVFIGGYGVKKIEEDAIANQQFTGHVIGSVLSRKTNEAPEYMKLEDKNATLSFNNGTSTLNASFDNWYDVKFTAQNDTNGTRTVEFSDPNSKVSDGSRYALLSSKDTQTGNFNFTATETQSENTPGPELHADIRYFGDNNTPVEAVGAFQVRDYGDGNYWHSETETPNEIRMNLGFGGVKQ